MCDRGNVEEIVHEMLVYLEMADYSIREEMVSHVWNMDVFYNLEIIDLLQYLIRKLRRLAIRQKKNIFPNSM